MRYDQQKSKKELRSFLEIVASDFSDYFGSSGSSSISSSNANVNSFKADQMDDSEFEGWSSFDFWNFV
jgi:hypothetical protein